MYCAIVDTQANAVVQFLGGVPESDLLTYPLESNQLIVSCNEFGGNPTDYVYSEANGIEFVGKPESPGEGFRFDLQNRVWVDFRTLDDVKNQRWSFIKLERERVINAKLDTPYGAVDSGEKDRVNITNSVMMLQTLEGLGTPGVVQFTMADNTSMELDTAKMVHIGLLLGQKIEAAHAKSRALREAIYSAETKEAVNAIFWE